MHDKLRKFLHGHKRAPRTSYTKLKTTFKCWGFHNAVSDAYLFIRRVQSVVLFILVYVDDILVIGFNSALLQSFAHDLDATFSLKTLSSVSYYVGSEDHRNSSLYLT